MKATSSSQFGLGRVLHFCVQEMAHNTIGGSFSWSQRKPILYLGFHRVPFSERSNLHSAHSSSINLRPFVHTVIRKGAPMALSPLWAEALLPWNSRPGRKLSRTLLFMLIMTLENKRRCMGYEAPTRFSQWSLGLHQNNLVISASLSMTCLQGWWSLDRRRRPKL
jgi:hypothetical protein